MGDNELTKHFDNAAGQQINGMGVDISVGRAVQQDVELRGETVLLLPVMDEKRYFWQGHDEQRMVGIACGRHWLGLEKGQYLEDQFLMGID